MIQVSSDDGDFPYAIFHCKPGQVRPLVDKFKAMAEAGAAEIMEGYHDLVAHGRREIYKVEA